MSSNTELRRIDPDASLAQVIAALNTLLDRDLGNRGSQTRLRDYNGNKQKVVTSGGVNAGAVVSANNYPLDVQSPLGLHAAFLLAATAPTAAPTPANAAVLIRDAGLLIGAGKALKLWNAAGTFGLSMDGTGATADRTITFPDATDTVALLGRAQTFSATNTFSSAAPIILSGTAARITGLFGDATRGSRPFFQSSAANGDTNVSAMPSGANTIGKFEAYNNSTPGSAAIIASLEANGTEARLTAASAAGAGAALQVYAGSTKAIDITSAGVVTFPVVPASVPFTPIIGGSATYTTQTGSYTKVGRLVSFRLHLKINAIGTGSVNTISGLPFSAGGNEAATVGYWASSATNYVDLRAFVSGSTITIYGATAAASGVTAATFFQAAAEIYINGHYET